MAKNEWHVTRVNENPPEIRRYKHITKMYKFILRNPRMFRGRTLTIYNHRKPVTNMTFDEIQHRVSLSQLETIERKYVLGLMKRLLKEEAE